MSRTDDRAEWDGIYSMDPITKKLIGNDFSYHPPTGQEQADSYVRVREAGLVFAELITTNVPPSPERSRAYDLIREAVMWANAGIACQPGRDEIWREHKGER